MSNKKRAGATSSANQKVNSEITNRLREIRALWFAVHNDPKHSVEQLAAEFYFKIGDLLEGKNLKQLVYHSIDKERVFEHVEDS